MAKSILDGVSLAVWDWNGTLLDDVRVNLDTINALLTRRGIRNIKDEAEYRGGFGFPIIDYYRTLGFDTEREAFSDIADEYVRVYGEKLHEAALASDAVETLSRFKNLGIRQVIISAAEGERLRREVKSYGIDGYFTDVIGTGDNLGSSKVSLAVNFVERCGEERGKILFIGDLLHDAEVATALGFTPILFSGGHNDKERLLQVAPIVDDLRDIFPIG